MDPDDIDPEIASAMGFASFGAQPAKRRKYTHDDAFVAGQEGGASAEKLSGSGANTTALGVRSKPMPAVQDAEAASGEQLGPGEAEKKEAAGKGKGKKGKKGAPMGLADYVSWGNTIAAQPSAQPAQSTAQQEKERGIETAQVETTRELDDVAEQAPVLNGGDGAGSWPQGMPGREELSALRRGVANKRGDMAYFMPSFIEDPWKGLVG